jgi:hypothetical protein
VKTTTNAIVCTALAQYLDLDPLGIHAWHHLELDLHMSPGDLALVARHVEDVGDLVLPREQLESTATVGELQSLVSQAASHDKSALGRVA